MLKNQHTTNSVAKSGFVLIAGGLLCKLIGAVYRIPLSNLLGAEGIGVYQLIFPVYSFTLVLVSGGLTFAVSKLTSNSLALGKKDKIAKHFFSALLFAVLFGGISMLLFFLLAKPLASFQKIPTAFYSYYVVGFCVFFASFIACFRGFFQGYSHMSSTVISQLIEQVVKLVLGLVLVAKLLPFGMHWAVLGSFVGLAVSEVLAFVYYLILSAIWKKKQKIKLFSKTKKISKKLFSAKVLTLAFPVTLSQLMVPLALGVQSLLVVRALTSYGLSEHVAKAEFGILSGMVNSLVSFPSVFSVSLGIILVPSVSYFLAQKMQVQASEIVAKVYKTLWIITLPCVVGFFTLAENILTVVFFQGLGHDYLTVAALILKVVSLQIVFVSFVQITTVLLQVLNKTWLALSSLACFFVLSAVLSLTLALKFGIVGMAAGNLLAYSIVCVLNMGLLKGRLSAQLKTKTVFLPLILSAFMGIIVHFLKFFLQHRLSSILFLALSLVVCVCFYFGGLIFAKVIKVKDLLKK